MLTTRKFLIGFYLISLIILSSWIWRSGYASLVTQSNQQLDIFSAHLQSQLQRFNAIPKLLFDQKLVVASLQDIDNAPLTEKTNRYLKHVNNTIGASDTYLLDISGTTIAANNWRGDQTFIGKNFAFRPYFQQAVTGQQGRYFALGTTSGQRGYYFSSPVIHADNIIGVVVVKMDLSKIEKEWTGKKSHFMVTDDDNVIFISNTESWLLHSLTPLNKDKLQQIAASRRYGNKTIAALNFSGQLQESPTLLQLTTSQPFVTNYLSMSKAMPTAGWTVRVFTPLTTIFIDIAIGLILLSLVFWLLNLRLKLSMHKRQRAKDKELLRIKTKYKLKQEVKRRTADLNNEIIERQKMEQTLRDTQKELIQTAKLAVLGQLSASISHELNNPLAAIRSYADNALVFLQREQYQSTDDNLQRIIHLTERMAKISSQLKFFARKSSGELHPVPLLNVINMAIELVRPQLKSNQVAITLDHANIEVQVNVDQVQLEQVLVNLLSNAIQAVEESSDKRIHVSLCRDQQQVIVQVDDSGTGISKENLSQLFDPFFTTKETGLGLGLSISHKIMRNMQGNITAENRPNAGARFSLILPLVMIPTATLPATTTPTPTPTPTENIPAAKTITPV